MSHYTVWCTFSILFCFVPLSGQQLSRSFEGTLQKEISVRYLIYYPPGYDTSPGKKWPMILFLHGSGERGKDLELVKRNGPPKLIAENKDFDFVIVSPQCPELEDWSNDALVALLDEVVANNRIDADRIYLTGLSMGGWGVWNLAIEYPGRFAALAPVCGRVERNNPAKASRLKNLPVWVFHGALDAVVPVTESDRMVTALREAGALVRFTVYPEAGHDSWTATYNNPELYTWFLTHTRSHEAPEIQK